MSEQVLRVRFHANVGDYRPVTWPPVGPYWCTGYGDGYSTLVAYVFNKRELKAQWPEASHLDISEVDGIEFGDRFQRPPWWTDELQDAWNTRTGETK